MSIATLRCGKRTQLLDHRFTPFRGEPFRKTGYRGQGDKTLYQWKAFTYLFYDLFDQKVTKRHTCKPRMTITDGVEDGCIQLTYIVRLICFFDNWRDSGRCTRSDRDFYKYQRIIRHRWMKKCKAHPVIAEPRSQIIPPLNRVHRLVANDSLEHRRWGLPINDTQLQKSAIEPRNEQLL